MRIKLLTVNGFKYWVSKHQVINKSLLLAGMLLAFDTIAQEEATPELTWDVYLQEFTKGTSFSELTTKKPSAQDQSLSANSVVSKVSTPWSELNQQYQLFMAAAEQKIIEANEDKIFSLILNENDLKVFNGLVVPYSQLRARHLLYLSYLTNLKAELAQTANASNAIDNIDLHIQSYASLVNPLFTAFDLLIEVSSQEAEDVSILNKVLANFDLRKIETEIQKISQQIQSIPIDILHNTELPNRDLSFNTPELILEPAIIPTYSQSELFDYTEDDLSVKEIDSSIFELAESLSHDPIAIYEYVLNNIENDWYAGMMKGASGTLAQLSGNSVDQSAVLIELLRSSNIPARYVTGVIELPVEELTELIGVDTTANAVLALDYAGIARKQIVSGGKVSAVQIEATWVSAQIPYSNYRGATVDSSGKIWLPLFPFLKTYQNDLKASLLKNSGHDAVGFQNQFLSELNDADVISELTSEIDGYLNFSGIDEELDELVSTRQIVIESNGYIPNSVPVEIVVELHEGSSPPSELVHQVRFYATADTSTNAPIIMDVTKPLYELASKQISLSYQAETQADQNLALSLGGIGNVPLNLINLRPSIKIQGRAIKVAEQGLVGGTQHFLNIDLISPAGTSTIQKSVFSGSFHSIGVAAQDAIIEDDSIDFTDDTIDTVESKAGRILSQIALRYLQDWSESDQMLAKLAARTLIKSLPSVVFVSNDSELEYLLSTPISFNWKGVNIDAIFRPTESVPHHDSVLDEADFHRLSGLQGSYLEHDIFERYFSVDSLSADKGLALAGANADTILQIDQNNIATDLVLLNHNQSVKNNVTEWVSQGYQVTIPLNEITLLEWTGSVWLVQDPLTGKSGYFISRGLAGGVTVDEWPEYLQDLLENPDLDEVNDNPDAAASVYLFPSSDQQFNVAGTSSEPLSVLVLDNANRPVKNAKVRLTLNDTNSGGDITGTSYLTGQESTDKEIIVQTNANGQASVVYEFPELISDSNTIRYSKLDPEDQYSNVVGVNFVGVTAVGSSGVALTSQVYFTTYTHADEAITLRLVPDEGGIDSLDPSTTDSTLPNIFVGSVDSELGNVWIAVEDQYGNRVANAELALTVQDLIYEDGLVVIAEHGIRTNDPSCISTLSFSLPVSCFVSEELRATDTLGRIYLSMKFGRVETNFPGDEYVEHAYYPITANLTETGDTLTLNYSAFELRMFQTSYYENAAVKVSGIQDDGSMLDSVYPGTILLEVNQPGEDRRNPDFIGGLLEVTDVHLEGPDGLTYQVSYQGTEFITISQMQVGTVPGEYTPVITWKFTDREEEEQTGEFHLGPSVTAVDIAPDPVDPELQLNFRGVYDKFAKLTYTSQPNAYSATQAHLLIYEVEPEQLPQTGQEPFDFFPAKSANGVNLSVGEASIPPTSFDLSKEYYAKFSFNLGSSISEVLSNSVKIPIDAPIIAYAGGSGAVIHDWVNNQSCTQKEPVFTLQLVQEAEVTITTGEGSGFTFISNQVLEAGTHEFDADDLGFQARFLTYKKTPFTVTAVATSNDREETRTGDFSFQQTDISPLPVGSPVYENVNLFKGNLFLSKEDIGIDGRGAGIQFIRSYSSQNDNDSSLGFAWSHNYDSYVQENACGWVTVSGGAAGGVTFYRNGNSFVPGRGFHGTLEDLGEDGWNFYSKDGTQYHYSRRYALEESPRYYLDYIADPNGNLTQLGYNPTNVVNDDSDSDETDEEIEEVLTGDALPSPYGTILNYPQVELVRDSSGREINIEYTAFANIVENLNEEAASTGSDLIEASAILFEQPRNLISKVTGLDYEIDYEYDKFGRLISVSNLNTSDSGEAIVEYYEYQLPDEIARIDELLPTQLAATINKIIDPRGIVTEYEYRPYEFSADVTVNRGNGDGNLTIPMLQGLWPYVVTSSQKESISSAYEYTDRAEWAQAVTATMTDPLAIEYLYAMDSFGRSLSVEGPMGTQTMTWSVNDTLMTTQEDENGVLTEYSYDEHGNVTQETVAGQFVVLSEYELLNAGTIKNRLSERTDRNGNTTNYDYDSSGNLTSITYPSTRDCVSCRESFSYRSNGDQVRSVDRRGNATTYSYDTYGNVSNTYYPIGNVVMKHDDRNRLISNTDENGNKTTYSYDWLDRLTDSKNAEGGTRSFAYDENSNKVELVDEAGRTTTHTFDFDNRIVNSSIESISRSFTYDANDNLLTESDYRGNVISHDYDDANRKETTTYPSNEQGDAQVATFEYDNTVNVVNQTVNGRVTELSYDDLYRVTETINPELGVRTNQYDGNGNLIESVDELNRVTQTQFDAHNQKIKQTDAVGSPVARSMEWFYDQAGNLVRYIDARGRDEYQSFDERNRLIATINAHGDRNTYTYDGYGNLIREEDHFYNEINYEYDELHRQILVEDQRGFETITAYDLVGNPIRQELPNGNVITREFDFLNRKTNERDSLGQVMAYDYDADSNPTQVTDAKGYVTTNTYDSLSQLTQVSQPEGRITSVTYDVFGNVLSSTDGEDNTTSYVYDKLDRKTEETDAANNSIVSVYDAVGNLTSQTDKRNNTTQWQYDELNRVAKLTEPLAGTHSREIINSYDDNDNLILSTDKRGYDTTYSYDRLNRVFEERRDDVLAVRNTYSEIGDLIGTEDANGNKTAMEYNARHEMVFVSRPESALARFEYDSMGDVVRTVDEENRETLTSYDERRRKISETNAESEVTAYQYDLNNNLIQTTRPNSNVWGYDYDELNRLVEVRDANSQISTYGYDKESNLTLFTDTNGNQTAYAYDALNRKSNKSYPSTDDGQASASYTYDANNNLKVVTDANGQIKTHSYDALNRLSDTQYSNAIATVGNSITSETYQYDGNNNVTQVSEAYSSAATRSDSYQYDSLDRLYERTDSFDKTLQYRYDLNGNRVTLIDADDIVSNYAFDGLNRLIRATTSQGQTNYAYDRSSLITQITYPNNTVASYDYDLAKRTTQILNQQNNATVSNYEYEYDLNGNRLEQRETNGGAEEVTTYDYDINDRLTEVVYDQGNTAEITTTYTYDAAYNRTSEVDTDANDVTVKDKTYRYNERNQLTQVDDNLDSNNSVSYEFDQNGNQIKKVKAAEQSDFVFDIRDDLREVQIGGSTVGQFLYDYQGLRIEKIGDRGTERSSYDGQSILQQYDANNATQAKFDYGGSKLLSLNSTGEPTQFYLTDALNSVVNLTNDQGSVQARYQYDAWGNKRSELGSSYNRFSFTGYEEDTETGLLYAKARFYDPDTGKFLSEDAWEGDQMIAPSLHRYLYAYQNPTVYVDLDGNAPYLSEMIQQLNSKADSYNEFALDERQSGRHRNATGASIISGGNRAVGALVGVANAAVDLVISTNAANREFHGYTTPEYGVASDSRANLAKVGQGISSAANTAANFGDRDVRSRLGTPLVETFMGVINNDPESLNKLAGGAAGSIVGAGVTSKVMPTNKKVGGNSDIVTESPLSAVPDVPNTGGIPLKNNSARKLLQSRGATKQQAKEVIDSFDGQVMATQGKKGDSFTITQTSNDSPASGLYVTRGSAGRTPDERIKNLALPESNKALAENKVSLSRDQILLEGKVKSQAGNPGFGDNATGGGNQVITDAFNGGLKRE